MRVYKYRGGNDEIFTRDLKSLENDIFWAPTRHNLNDPCEGFVSCENFRAQLDSIVKRVINSNNEVLDAAEQVSRQFEKIVDKRNDAGIYSLSKTFADELLWAHYANSHNGFCVEYDLDILVKFGRSEFESFDVVYSENLPVIDVRDLSAKDSKIIVQKIMGYKSKRWSYEKEHRIVTSFSGGQSYDFRAVKGIYFGLKMSEEKEQEVMKALAGRQIKYYKIQLREDSYKLQAAEVPDPYKGSAPYLYSIAPIASFAISPDLINSRWSGFEGYLYKTAEIIRREPYCNLVESVGISLEKSRENKPVFFGTYKRCNNNYETLHFSIEEIDRLYSKIDDLDQVVK